MFSVNSKATLVIAPVSLVGQWQAELQEKSSRNLKTFVFHGSNRPHSAAQLAACDVVITTFVSFITSCQRELTTLCLVQGIVQSENSRLSPAAMTARRKANSFNKQLLAKLGLAPEKVVKVDKKGRTRVVQPGVFCNPRSFSMFTLRTFASL